jgi:peptidoglycan/LPS O-acetylase OafA/YrhL
MNAVETATISPSVATRSAPVRHAITAGHDVVISSLRAFLTVLVLAHHAALGYVSFMPPPTDAFANPVRMWRAFPILDDQRSGVLPWFVGFNDSFFMSLMFLVSGLFVWKSLERKGASAFVRDRLLRLGVPFALAAGLLAPLAYYPAYLQRTAEPSVADFVRTWLSFPDWSSGPAWFVWLLLAFDIVVASWFVLAPGALQLGGLGTLGRRPIVFFGVLVALSALVYVPMAQTFGPIIWAAFGPFTFQTSRILHYFVYLLVGVGLGRYGIDKGLFAADGVLRRHWGRWTSGATLVFVVGVALVIAAFADQTRAQTWATAGNVWYPVTCAAISLAVVALFVRFAGNARHAAFASLRDNAYGIYLVHYAFNSWLQYALLRAPLPAMAKFACVLAGTLALSWMSIAALRRIPAVARVV